MSEFTIKVSNVELAKLERCAQATGRTGTSVLTEWARIIMEYPDDALRLLARLVHQLPPAQVDDEAGDDLDGLRRRAGIRRRRQRTRPTVTVTRLEEPGQDNSGVPGAASGGGATAGSAGASTIGSSGATTNGPEF